MEVKTIPVGSSRMSSIFGRSMSSLFNGKLNISAKTEKNNKYWHINTLVYVMKSKQKKNEKKTLMVAKLMRVR